MDGCYNDNNIIETPPNNNMSKNNNNNESRLVKLLVVSKLWKIITKNSKVPLDGWNNDNKNNNSNNHGVCVVYHMVARKEQYTR